MTYLRAVPASVNLFFVLLQCWATANAEMLPRDLDQNPSTVEAYYDTQFDITVIAHPNLPLSEKFGIPQAVESDCRDGIFCNQTVPGIDRYGFMEWPTADNYIAAMNTSNYMGYSNWRLPDAGFVWDRYRWLGDTHELDEVLGSRHSMYLPVYGLWNYRFLTGAYHPTDGRAYVRWGSTTALGTSPADGLTRFAVWPVLDGDAGNEVGPAAQQFCSDFDGDGYGWNGTSSCVARDFSFFAEAIKPLEPRDLDGDLSTAEAYYHPQLEMTWLANSRLAQSRPLGLSNSINSDGSFDRSHVATEWINLLNQHVYLGYSQWRLPEARNTFEFRYLNSLYDSEFDVLAESIVRLTSGTGQRFELLEGGYFVDNNFRTLVTELRDRSSHFSAYVDDIDWRDSYFAWPVHDGDIGTPVNEEAPCIDTDGDGWGWTGTASCKI